MNWGLGRTPAAAEPAQDVVLRGIAKRFGENQVIEALDLEVVPGELLVLLGPSGCGKSTLLRLIAGLEEPSAGSVSIGGRAVDDVPPALRNVAMVFQSYALYPHMTVAQNLGFGLKSRGLSRAEIHDRVARTAETLELSELLERKPGQLSGGQQQRVALGRALVREPGVFLLDEPLSNLDAGLRLKTRDEIAALHRRLGTTMVFVTHDQMEAMSLGQRIAVMDQGRLQQIGTPEQIYDRPANLFVARFIGTPAINLAPLSPEDPGRLTWGPVRLHDPWAGAPATLAVRPEGLARAAADAGDMEMTVVRVEPLGSEKIVHALPTRGHDGGRPWTMRVSPAEAFTPGETVHVALDWSRSHLFDANGTRHPDPPQPLGGAG
ncbi:MAG: ABC transporter ATP-binding protein [Gemmatimonadetes bacterium]|nr:ABC transporter ATP-binding protein [Gemmatimonadota bacterium]